MFGLNNIIGNFLTDILKNVANCCVSTSIDFNNNQSLKQNILIAKKIFASPFLQT